ncbi:hypothetical protein JTB14_029880 [Gonioctena quinquepunctata]|nr:hypothetical protein JTB14_029880 [Gonioctena quinquepunctata]
MFLIFPGNIVSFCFLIIVNSALITAQSFWKIATSKDTRTEEVRDKLTWCTISPEEQFKCKNFSEANDWNQIQVGYKTIKIECYQASNKDECMQLLDEEKATVTTLDAGAIFMGGRYHSLVPIAQEVLEGGHTYYYAVAVVKKGTFAYVNSLHQMRGRRVCFAGVETFAGWVLPIYTLMKEGGMEIIDCNNHIKSATNYFGPSCAVNCLEDEYNPIGDNSDKLCQLCIGAIPGGRCTDSDPYAGYEGAFRCLLEAGEIAFLKHNTVPELLAGVEFGSLSVDNFELFCKDGTRRPINEYLACNWGKVPSDAIVTSSAVPFETRARYQKFLVKFAEKYSKSTLNSTFTGQSNFRNNQYSNDQNRNTDEYDQFGNRVNRYKRQNFGNANPQDNPYGPPYNGNSDYNPYTRNDGSTEGYNQNNDPFARDPYNINRDQYGVNIDPYETDIKYNTDRDRFSGPQGNYDVNRNTERNQTNGTQKPFNLFESIPRYGIHGNLLFQDATRGISAVPENLQTYSNFLGESLDIIMGIRDCPVNRMVMCVTSDAEKNKCVKMRTALKAQLLKPEMDCYKGYSQINCMQAIRAGTADVAVLDASDVYTAGLNFDLVPFISEVYNLEDSEYYVVAVGKESDPSTELTYLKNKNTCHGGISTAAGWVYPLAFLISNGWIRPYGCNSIRAAAEYFSKSCVPGALSTEYNTGVPYDNMCDLCHGPSFRYCRRDASEDYYGHTGAFRCLVEGGGHVAFVKHTTVTENTGGKKREWWARDNLNDDYELLCPDGTRAEINEYTKCNLGKKK